MKTSASQLVKFRRCQRAYAFEYVEGFRPPPSIKQQFGSAVHSNLEKWLKEGKPPNNTPAGETAKQGLRYLPAPKENLLVEHNFEIQWDNNIRVGGFIDCLHLWEVPVIIDHKTTSNLRWAKTKEDLYHDEQALLYSAWAMREYNSPYVIAKWIYYSATNPKSGLRKPNGCKQVFVSYDVNEENFISSMERINQDFKKILHIRNNVIQGKELPPSFESCDLFGGCPHKIEGRCDDLTAENIFTSAMKKVEII